jgi:murein DD-endopeptidase MepM/ murein hydrolase activator NlpD
MTYDPGAQYRSGRGYSAQHGGQDWPAADGTPIPAAAAGEVWHVQQNHPTYGNVVVLRHTGSDGSTYYTLYAHQNGNQLPTVGTQVTAGQTIGEVGNTGLSTGPHLHFEVIDGSQPIPQGSTGGMGPAGQNRFDPDTFGGWPAGGPYNGFPNRPLRGDIPEEENYGGTPTEVGGYSDSASDKFADAKLPVDPLVLDLDGDGLELIALADSSAFFDLDGNGFVEHTGWVARDDGLLALEGVMYFWLGAA